MEIERKFLIHTLPDDYTRYPSTQIEQAYLSNNPVVRIRQDGEDYYLTYKGSGLMVREEYNLPLTKESYHHLLAKADGIIIRKRRYRIPLEGNLVIELDLFEGAYEGLITAEVEFSDENMATSFVPPDWFGEDVTMNPEYKNSSMALSYSR